MELPYLAITMEQVASTCILTRRDAEGIERLRRALNKREVNCRSCERRIALGQSAPATACCLCIQPLPPGQSASGRFLLRLTAFVAWPSDQDLCFLPGALPGQGFSSQSPATRPPLSPSAKPFRTSLSSGRDAEKCTRRADGSDWSGIFILSRSANASWHPGRLRHPTAMDPDLRQEGGSHSEPV